MAIAIALMISHPQIGEIMTTQRSLATLTLCALILALPTASLAVDSDTATRQITAAYEDLLGRKPDDAGLKNFRTQMVDKGLSESKMRAAIKKSDEYKGKDADAIITRAYKDVLDRKPDSSGLKTFREKINAGWSEERLRKELRKSDEYKKLQKKK